MISHLRLRQLFTDFWTARGHVEVPAISLIPQNDPTTLFTGSGMQQFVPNLLGEPHPQGTRLFNIQRCFRAQDIEEVGDNRHDTFFEMMGNWSLGDYFKKEQLTWCMEFFVDTLGLDVNRLYVTVFSGDEANDLAADTESIVLWESIFKKYGIDAKLGERIFPYDATKNWWSRAGTPSNMPVGEPGGPDSEVFFHLGDFHTPAFGETCHVNCDCGSYIEIANNVFMQYKKTTDGFELLPKPNVDVGYGFERVVMAVQDKANLFDTDLFAPVMQLLGSSQTKEARIVADHLRCAVFLAADGLTPGPREQGYVMRRLIRRAIQQANKAGISTDLFPQVIATIQSIYAPVYHQITGDAIAPAILREIDKYIAATMRGAQEVRRVLAQMQGGMILSGQDAFNIYQSTGLPSDDILLIAQSVGAAVDMSGFDKAKEAHADLSRSSSEQKFKGGLADQGEQTVRYHTATHLLHQALFDIVGPSVRQEGSNITGARLRFDFAADHKPTPEELAKVSTIVNEKINAKLPVSSVVLPKAEAEKVGAKSFFKEKYPDMVKVYYIGNTIETAYSKEFCGGPHVGNTGDIGKLEIYKLEKIGSNLYRIYAK